MKNIDKSISKLKMKIEALSSHIDNYYKNDCETAICRELVEERNALINVLSELETKIGQVRLLDEEVFCLNIKLDKKDNEILAKDKEILDIAKGKFETNKENFELKAELKTYKKMTEYFAVKLYDLANEKMKEEYTTAQECCEYAKLRDICVRDMIISARKEVEK